MQNLIFFLQTPFGVKLCIILAVAIFGFSIPLWYWRLPTFSAIRKRIASLGKTKVDVNFSGSIDEFEHTTNATYRITSFVRLESLEDKVSTEIQELTITFIFFTFAQVIVAYYYFVTSGSGADFPEGELAKIVNNMISLPLLEVVFLFLFSVNTLKFRAEWKKLEKSTK